jgi:hypothetical protein
VEEIWNVESWRNYNGIGERYVFPVSGGGRYGAHFIKVYWNERVERGTILPKLFRN